MDTIQFTLPYTLQPLVMSTETTEEPKPVLGEEVDILADRKDWFTWKFFNRVLPPEKRRYIDDANQYDLQTAETLKAENVEFIYFSQLPLELWNVVLGFFGRSLKYYFTLRNVCKSFQKIIELDQFWKQRFFATWNMGLLFGSPNPKYNWKQLYRQEYENYKNRGCFTLKLNKDGMRIIGSSTQIDFLGMTVNVGLKSGKWVYELEMVKSCLTQNGFICTKFETGSGASVRISSTSCYHSTSYIVLLKTQI